jgi:hypothetical protein
LGEKHNLEGAIKEARRKRKITCRADNIRATWSVFFRAKKKKKMRNEILE